MPCIRTRRKKTIKLYRKRSTAIKILNLKISLSILFPGASIYNSIVFFSSLALNSRWKNLCHLGNEKGWKYWCENLWILRQLMRIYIFFVGFLGKFKFQTRCVILNFKFLGTFKFFILIFSSLKFVNFSKKKIIFNPLRSQISGFLIKNFPPSS